MSTSARKSEEPTVLSRLSQGRLACAAAGSRTQALLFANILLFPSSPASSRCPNAKAFLADLDCFAAAMDEISGEEAELDLMAQGGYRMGSAVFVMPLRTATLYADLLGGSADAEGFQMVHNPVGENGERADQITLKFTCPSSLNLTGRINVEATGKLTCNRV